MRFFSLKTILAVLPQYLLPQHFLSLMMAKLTHAENKLWKNLFINTIIKLYGVDMAEAKQENVDEYVNFNAFFTRELKIGTRQFPSDQSVIACPADGFVSQIGTIQHGKIIQAKGKKYTVSDLLAGRSELTRQFFQGSFATIYLSPKDYHRLHMPMTGTLERMIHIPGRLFSVNDITSQHVSDLFARNERVVSVFETAAGPMALILVGAIFVCSIETVWHGVVTPPTQPKVRSWHYHENLLTLQRGEEMGRFNMGSTIIVLFGRNSIEWLPEIRPGQSIQLGNSIGKPKVY